MKTPSRQMIAAIAVVLLLAAVPATYSIAAERAVSVASVHQTGDTVFVTVTNSSKSSQAVTVIVVASVDGDVVRASRSLSVPARGDATVSLPFGQSLPGFTAGIFDGPNQT